MIEALADPQAVRTSKQAEMSCFAARIDVLPFKNNPVARHSPRGAMHPD
jgi:hypothetical protein